MKTSIKTGAAFLVMGIMTAHAQQFEDAASVPFGSFDFTPTIDVGLLYDDNVTLANEDAISSWSRIISPRLSLVSSLGGSQVSLSYRLRDQAYFSSSEDNTTDHFFSAQAQMEFNSRHRAIATVNYEDSHDDRGANFSIGLGEQLEEPDQHKQSELDLLYTYGSFNSKGRLDLNFNITELNYDINTPIYRARDRQFVTLGGTFYYQIGAATDATFDIIYDDIDYSFDINPNNPLDSEQISYLVGLEWEATAQTAGFAKIGYQEKDFDSPLREDFSGIDWAVGVLWEPVSYASFELITRADTNETNGEGNFIRGRTHSLEWRHEWLERLRSSVLVRLDHDRYEGQLIDGFDIRKDDNQTLRASVFYQFRRWLNFEVAYWYDERDSNRDFIDYDRNRFLINALITL